MDKFDRDSTKPLMTKGNVATVDPRVMMDKGVGQNVVGRGITLKRTETRERERERARW